MIKVDVKVKCDKYLEMEGELFLLNMEGMVSVT
jgi:hypothetical protein